MFRKKIGFEVIYTLRKVSGVGSHLWNDRQRNWLDANACDREC
jgi:hypothetical protein